MVGSAIERHLSHAPSDQDLPEIITQNRKQLNLLDQAQVHEFFNHTELDEVYLAAAHVGGIHANDAYPADFIYQNLMIECNVIEGAFRAGVQKLLLLGSSCIYPRNTTQPMSESELLSGALEPTNEPYAIAKIAGIKLCESYNRQYGVDYRSVMPTNLYGENDNFHPQNSHVIPAMMRRFHGAKLAHAESVEVWGSGEPKREFLYVDDMAAASVHVMNLCGDEYQQLTNPRMSHINVGTGVDCSIAKLAECMRDVVGFEGDITYDTSKPDGTPRKLLDVSRLKSMGWQYKIGLRAGLQTTYAWFLENESKLRGVEQ